MIKAASRTALGEPLLLAADDLARFLKHAQNDPQFRAAYERAQHWEIHHPLPLAIDGQDYSRRQSARRRRRHR